ncbi:HlyD family efflux transporter periplasmic adaptor subunit [Massilia sp. G4R7]|uniref:HlyD family efflux transporter periplasmic adaptor subunit n=1 Tax=Massilia phyllostachyos TaxID=2898585 RepID=A0ABS8QCK7_9BURK|nr:HlyD family efflux transporter periplasmic adaptor subunit [Massilia phyllostachyos]MCD2518656.1 HlyD family efflux transporter periplasmic adaptor subunit [Massilia phyllostachyos]
MDRALDPALVHRRRRIRVAVAIVSLALAVLACWQLNRLLRPSVAASDIVISTVRRGDVANTVSAAGVVIPVHEEVVASPAASRVARVLARPGQQVKAGDVLLELDDREIVLAVDTLREQLAQQESRVATSKLELEQKHKQLASAIELLELDLLSSRALNERNQKLRLNGLVSGENLLAGELAVKRAEIQLRQQRELIADSRRATAASIAAATLQQDILKKQLAQQERKLAQAKVAAPFSGMLTTLVQEEGASVAAGQLLARVSELNNYRVEATLSDFHARLLAPGQAVRVEQNGEVLPGRVHTVLPEIQNGTVKLLVDLDKPDNPLLRNKMRVDVNIVTAQKQDVLVLDSGMAFNGSGAQAAFAVVDGVARRTTLQLGGGDGKLVEVVRGARPGERYIVSDTKAFANLDSIRITN